MSHLFYPTLVILPRKKKKRSQHNAWYTTTSDHWKTSREILARNFMRRNKNACYRNQHRKTMRTISMLIVIYMCTWVLSILTTDAIHFVADVEWRFIMWMVAVSAERISGLHIPESAFHFRACYRCCALHRRSTSATREAPSTATSSDDYSNSSNCLRMWRYIFSKYVVRRKPTSEAYHLWWRDTNALQ